MRRRAVLDRLLQQALVHRRPLAWLFAAVLLPLYGFGALAEDVWSEGGLDWDAPVLRRVHAHATPRLDTAMLLVSRLGFLWGTVPLTLLVLVLLLVRRRARDALFFMLAAGGSAALNLLVKGLFHRARPALWPSLAPEASFSFPSGHTMGSMALAAALAALAWPTRARAPLVLLGALYVGLVALSRVYLGVHYPSDVLAGALAALAWVAGVRFVLFGRRGQGMEPPPGPPGGAT